jgi:hypothetical protein
MRPTERQPVPHLHKEAALYHARHPAQTLRYRTIAGHFETWLELVSAGQFDGQGGHHTPPVHVAQAFRKYLECGIFAHGFARARCGGRGDHFLIAFSCKGRAVCPSCNTRRMVETAAHLTDHVFPHLPVRQWVLSVPKRLRYFLQVKANARGLVEDPADSKRCAPSLIESDQRCDGGSVRRRYCGDCFFAGDGGADPKLAAIPSLRCRSRSSRCSHAKSPAPPRAYRAGAGEG